MSESIHFILSKHPYAHRGGDSTMTRLLMNLCSELGSVSATALWKGPVVQGRHPVCVIEKPPVSPVTLGFRSLRRRRSLVHSRFDVPDLSQALQAQKVASRYIAEHTYMAESALRAGLANSLYINTHVVEANVLRGGAKYGRFTELEARRTWRDEVRCATASRATACFAEEEVEAFSDEGVRNVLHLELSFPPALQASLQSPNVLFLGDRQWPPNMQALETTLRIWPAVRQAVPDSRLLVVGPGPIPKQNSLGVDFLGSVPDLASVWSNVRCLIAPIQVGGGVRVKILEAAARGVPVVSTPAGIGSLGRYLPIAANANESEIGDAVLQLLRDQGLAGRIGNSLYEANRSRWVSGVAVGVVASWLRL